MGLKTFLTNYLRKKGYIIRPLIKRKNPFAKPGQCKIIEPYDLEADLKAKAEEDAIATRLPFQD